MTPKEWIRIKAIFDECLDLEPEERRRYLDTHCGEAETRREVESLLESYDQAGTFIERPVLEEPVAGRRIGAWEIVEEIGEGGIGRVYRAGRAGEFEQIAALKLLKLGVASDEVSRHFLAERRILATLNHPNIARLIDGGITADGRPYFVMEFVEGVSIAAFVEERGLSPKQISALMRQVCNAVDYAHRHLVVHRDLKPSNVLVTPAGEAKLLDFGVAKMLHEDEQRTATGVRLLTPDYASPEQIRGETVTTASDIYSLGVMLYRLLSKKSPYRVTGSSELAIAIALEREQVTKPSAAVEPGALRQALAGDLDTIVMKALEPDPARRYASAGELAADLLRYESGYPILARPQTVRYRLRKLVARNRLATAAAVVATFAVFSGVAATLWQAQVARVERLRAEKRYNDVRQLANSLLFDVHDAIEDLAGATKARALVVARATEYLDRVSADAPADARVRLELANAYIRLGDVQGNGANSNLGDSASATQSFRKAAGLLEPLAARGGDPQVQRALAAAYTKLGGLENAKRALAIREALARASPGDTAARNALARSYFFMGLAFTDQRDYTQALGWYERDRGIIRELLAAKPDDVDLLQSYAQAMKRRGAILVMLQRAPEALASYQEALGAEERWASQKQESHDAQMAISFSESDIGMVLRQQKRYPESIRHYERAVAIRENLRARDPNDDRARWSVWSATWRLGLVYAAAGQPAKSLKPLLESEQAARPRGPLESADARRLGEWIDSCASLADEYRALERRVESLRWGRSALDGCRELERRNQTTPHVREIAEQLRKKQAVDQ